MPKKPIDRAAAPNYTPQPGSLAERVLDWFVKNPEEELSSADIARKFDVLATSNVIPQLAAALTHDLLRRERGIFLAGPRFAAWAAARAEGGMASVAPHAPLGGRRRTAAPLINPDDITIHPGVASPRSGKNSTDNLAARWRQVYARMEPNTHIEVPRLYAITTKSVLTKWRREHPDQVWSTTLSAETIAVNRHA
ncbi:MAG: hypothetical protein AB1412_05380 [Pseudomonadota bacterium]